MPGYYLAMDRRVSSNAVIIAIAVVSLVGSSACVRDQVKSEQKRFAQRYTPATLRARSKPQGDARPVKLRIYAGHEYRAQNRRWREQFESYLDLANQLLVPELGLQLQVAGYEDWTRQTPNDKMDQLLEELEGIDAAADVDLVVGLTSSLSVVSSSMRELGRARYMGRHMILRGFNDLAEFKSFSTGLTQLEESERKRFFAARKQHKQAAVLLHEFGHLFGAMHVDPKVKSIMSPLYSHEATNFAPQVISLMRVIAAAKIPDPDKDTDKDTGGRSYEAELRALYDYLAGTDPWPGWIAKELEETRAWLADFDKALAESGARPDGDKKAENDQRKVPKEAEAMYARVRQLVARRELEAAWTELEGLLSAYPANTEFRLTACMLLLMKDRSAAAGGAAGSPAGAGEAGAGTPATWEISTRTIEQCKRVGELDPGDVRGELTLARTHVEAGRVAEARAVLVAAAERLPALAPEVQTAAWSLLIGFYRGLNAVTWAQEAAASAPPSDATTEVATWVAQVRRRYGLPVKGKRFGITPEREGEYVITVRNVLDLTYAKQYPQAKKLAREGLRRFRNAPGLLGALCDLEVRSGRFGAARPFCQRAVTGYPDISWARYLLGIIELHYRRNGAGINHLKRAIASDPDLKQAYHALAKAYVRVKNQKARDELDQSYQQRFGVAIP